MVVLSRNLAGKGIYPAVEPSEMSTLIEGLRQEKASLFDANLHSIIASVNSPTPPQPPPQPPLGRAWPIGHWVGIPGPLGFTQSLGIRLITMHYFHFGD